MRTLTVFDLDETLVHGDTSVTWRRFLQEKGIITDPDFSAKDNEMMQQYAQGTLNLQEYMDFSLAPLSQIDTKTVDALVAECVMKNVVQNVYPKAQALTKSLLLENPNDVLIISATVSFIVKQVAKSMGIRHAIGVDLAVKSGCYSSEIVGVPSFQEGKVERLKSWLTANEIDDTFYERIVFYTDSINDLPMCEFADEVHTVNPCPQLLPIAKANDWSILRWTL